MKSCIEEYTTKITMNKNIYYVKVFFTSKDIISYEVSIFNSKHIKIRQVAEIYIIHKEFIKEFVNQIVEYYKKDQVLNAIDELYYWATQSKEVKEDEVLKNIKIIEDKLGVRK